MRLNLKKKNYFGGFMALHYALVILVLLCTQSSLDLMSKGHMLADVVAIIGKRVIKIISSSNIKS